MISPDGKVEAVNEDIPTENVNNNITDNEKVSWFNLPYLLIIIT